MLVKLVLSLILLLSVVHAEGIHWEKDYKSALQKSLKEHKPLFFVVSKKTCKWCTHYKNNALKDPLVIKALNRDFVSVIEEMEDGGVPKDLWTPGTPATWFIGKNGEPMYQPLMGSQPATTLLQAFAIITKEYHEAPKPQKIQTH